MDSKEGKVQVSQAVYDGLEAIRSSGATNMFAYSTVLELAEEWGYEDTALWLMDNKKVYSKGIFNGFEVDETNQPAEVASKQPAELARERAQEMADAKQRFEAAQEATAVIEQAVDPNGSMTWYVAEYDHEKQLVFCYVDGIDFYGEWGYSSIDEIKACKQRSKNPLAIPIERDFHFYPTTFSEIKEVKS